MRGGGVIIKTNSGQNSSQPIFETRVGVNHKYTRIGSPLGTDLACPYDSLFKDAYSNGYTLSTMKGKNYRQWLVLGATEPYDRSFGDHCKFHLARLWKGNGTLPCMEQFFFCRFRLTVN